MQTKFIEATNGPQNWGKFMLGRFMPIELARTSAVAEGPYPLLGQIGHNPRAILAVDLQTREGAFFVPGGMASADLAKHAIWVCPLFEPFLTWLYEQDLADLDALPAHVDLPDAPFAMSGYRRSPFDELAMAFRVNALRWNPKLTHAEIDAVIDGCR